VTAERPVCAFTSGALCVFPTCVIICVCEMSLQGVLAAHTRVVPGWTIKLWPRSHRLKPGGATGGGKRAGGSVVRVWCAVWCGVGWSGVGWGASIVLFVGCLVGWSIATLRHTIDRDHHACETGTWHLHVRAGMRGDIVAMSRRMHAVTPLACILTDRWKLRVPVCLPAVYTTSCARCLTGRPDRTFQTAHCNRASSVQLDAGNYRLIESL
jgi:hypothetical protein